MVEPQQDSKSTLSLILSAKPVLVVLRLSTQGTNLSGDRIYSRFEGSLHRL